MALIPTAIITVWLLGLLAFGLIGGGSYLIYEWYRRAWAYDPQLDHAVFAPTLGFNGPTALLAAGIALLVWAVAGRLLVSWLLGLVAWSRAGSDPPRYTRQGVVHRLPRPDGSELQVECYGAEDGLPIVLTHGWGATSTEWSYLKQQLTDRFRLIVWDLPGLGRSTRPTNNDYSMEKLARDLEAVLGFAGNRPAILLGHSIGAMVILTFCRLFPAALGTRVAGLVLAHATYTNPMRTT